MTDRHLITQIDSHQITALISKTKTKMVKHGKISSDWENDLPNFKKVKKTDIQFFEAQSFQGQLFILLMKKSFLNVQNLKNIRIWYHLYQII